ncbi:MAG TPA: CoF synthetase [Clostridiales bacterium]|nr:CoF synthetase [Clostridiales bacterium]
MISPIETIASETSGYLAPIDERSMLIWQISKVKDALRRAKEKNPAYEARFSDLHIDDIDSYEAMSLVAFTYPEEVTEDPGAFVCETQRNISRITSLSSSGSTGKPKRIYFTDNDLDRTVRLFEMGMRPIIKDCKRCLIMMSDSSPGSIASLLKEGVQRNGTPAVIYGNISNVDDAAKAVLEGDAIVGIPSAVIHMCKKYPHLRPGSVLLSADYIPAPAVAAIRKLWRCRVYTHYGMTETGFGCAVQCSETSEQHIRHDSLLIEIIDPISGRQLSFDQEGEIVITTFANEAMPLFRYRTGDISSLINGRCECGSLLPRLGRVKGRIKNRIEMAGSIFSIEMLDDLIYAFDDVWEYSAELISARNEKELLITVIGGNGLKLPELRRPVATLVPACLKVRVDLVPSISRSFRKRHLIVSNL